MCRLQEPAFGPTLSEQPRSWIRGYLGLRARREMAAMLDGPPEFTDLVVVSDLVV